MCAFQPAAAASQAEERRRRHLTFSIPSSSRRNLLGLAGLLKEEAVQQKLFLSHLMLKGSQKISDDTKRPILKQAKAPISD